jgi:hypothetical protein
MWRQFMRTKGWDAPDFKKLSGLGSAVAGDDLTIITDQHGIGEAEPLDAVSDLPDLLFWNGRGHCVHRDAKRL